MTTEGRPVLSNFSYKEYTLEHLETWVLDALSCDDITPKEVYETIVTAVSGNVKHHKKELDKSVGLLYLIKGHHDSEIGMGNDKPFDSCDRDDKSQKCKQQWDEFWEAL